MLQSRKRIAALPLVVALTAVVVLAGGIVAASIPAADGTINGCYQKNNGQLRVVESADKCNPSELALTWQQQGPQGPEGPAGPQGPEGQQGPAGASTAGPPYVWVCTPASFANFASTSRADVFVFNGSASPANVSVRIFDKFGNDLANHDIPGTSGPVVKYPDVSNVAVTTNNTLDVNFFTPVTSPDPTTDVSFSVKVTSDLPVVVSSDFRLSLPSPVPCSPLPK